MGQLSLLDLPLLLLAQHQHFGAQAANLAAQLRDLPLKRVDPLLPGKLVGRFVPGESRRGRRRQQFRLATGVRRRLLG